MANSQNLDAQLGILMGFRTRLGASREDDALTLGANQVGKLVETRDRNATLTQPYARALMASA